DLFQRANYDALTGLANRQSFMSRLDMALARAERLGTGVAVLFIDLDHFKPINDVHGHDAGDAALRIAAQRIKSVLRVYDTPARFGGDEFAVLLEGIHGPHDAANTAHKLVNVLAQAIPHRALSLAMGASIGIACSGSKTAEAMLQQADAAMYC